jgi:hypothetical protein
MDKWREDVYTWCKVHVVEGMYTCPWVFHHPPLEDKPSAGR